MNYYKICECQNVLKFDKPYMCPDPCPYCGRMTQNYITYRGEPPMPQSTQVIADETQRSPEIPTGPMTQPVFSQMPYNQNSGAAGVYDSYVSKTEGLFAQYESQFNERYSSFESTLDNWDKELLSAYTEFMAKIKLFQSDAENEFNTWFESIKDKLGEDIAGSLQLQIEELAAAMQEVKKQAEAGTKETKEAIAALDERLKRVESGWGIDYKHDAVLGLCYMGAAYMSQHYERTVETAVLGATYVGNSYLANTF